jgi:hypothetical protein
MTNGDILRAQAGKQGIPLVSIWSAQETSAGAKWRSKGKNADVDAAMAALMLKHGRLTPEARNWLRREYPACAS